MTDEQRKAGHEAIKLLFRAALHPGQVPQSIIFESQQTLSALLEKSVSPDTRTFQEKFLERNYNRGLDGQLRNHPCGEISLDERTMGSEVGAIEADREQGKEWGRGSIVSCVRPSGSWGTVGVPDISEGITPSYSRSYGLSSTNDSSATNQVHSKEFRPDTDDHQ